MENKTHRNGYAILKEKYEKIERRSRALLDDREATIDEQASLIKRLRNDLAESQNNLLTERAKNNKLVDELFAHMGWWRRWLWELGHVK